MYTTKVAEQTAFEDCTAGMRSGRIHCTWRLAVETLTHTYPVAMPSCNRPPGLPQGSSHGAAGYHAVCCSVSCCRFGGFGSDLCSGNVEESWRDRSEFVRLSADRARERFPGEDCLYCLCLVRFAKPRLGAFCNGKPL